MFIYIIRFGTLDWATIFLYDVKGIDQVSVAIFWTLMPLARLLTLLTCPLTESHTLTLRMGYDNTIWVNAFLELAAVSGVSRSFKNIN